MNRRRALTALAIALFAAVVAAGANAQTTGKMYRVGILGLGAPEQFKPLLKAFHDGLASAGYIEGKNLVLESRWSEGGIASDKSAIELVHARVDVILAFTTAATSAALKATQKIPIVMVGVADPIGFKFVETLARPGGNVTGVTNIARDLSAKLLALLTEIAPRAKRIGVVRNPCTPISKAFLAETERAAERLGVELHVVHACAQSEIETAFEGLKRAGVETAIVLADPVFLGHRGEVARLALRHRVATAFSRKENAEAGGLMSYGPNIADQFRSAAGYVHRILQGAVPAEMPVEQPTRLELVVNLRTARALGISIPQAVLLRTDRVIE
jgi:putative ABC transport system substrate-binding protein